MCLTSVGNPPASAGGGCQALLESATPTKDMLAPRPTVAFGKTVCVSPVPTIGLPAPIPRPFRFPLRRLFHMFPAQVPHLPASPVMARFGGVQRKSQTWVDAGDLPGSEPAFWKITLHIAPVPQAGTVLLAIDDVELVTNDAMQDKKILRSLDLLLLERFDRQLGDLQRCAHPTIDESLHESRASIFS